MMSLGQFRGRWPFGAALGLALALCWFPTARAVGAEAAQVAPPNPSPANDAAPPGPKARAPLVVYLPRADDAPAPSSTSSSTERVKGIGGAIQSVDRKPATAWVLTTLASVLLGGVVVLRLRRRARICPKCLTPLSQLGDPRDSGEDVDESAVASYDESREPIWACHLCGEIGTLRSGLIFSSTRACPRCERRTLVAKITPIERSSYLMYGLARVDEDCPCGHSARYLRSTPPYEAPDAGRGGFTVRR